MFLAKRHKFVLPGDNKKFEEFIREYKEVVEDIKNRQSLLEFVVLVYPENNDKERTESDISMED